MSNPLQVSDYTLRLCNHTGRSTDRKARAPQQGIRAKSVLHRDIAGDKPKLLALASSAHPAASRIIAFSISASTLAIALVPRSWPISMSVCVSCANSRTGT
jgi:hypothetical protein